MNIISFKNYIYAVVFFVFLFSGRGGSFDLGWFALSFGIVLSIVYIVFNINKINLNYINSNLVLTIAFFIFLFIFYSFLSLFYTKSFYYGLEKTSNLFLFVIVSLFLFSLTNRINFLNTLKILVSLILPLALYYIYINIQSGFEQRTGIFGAGSITTGRIFCFFAILAFYFFVKEKSIIKFLFFFIYFFAVFSSGSRGNLIFLSVALILPWIIANFKFFIKFVFVFIAIGFILIKTRLYESLPYFYRYSLLFDGGGDSILIRLAAYQKSWDIFQSNFIFGVGSGGYSYYSLGRDEIDYPHNLFLEIASELGIIGLILFFIILVLTFLLNLKNTLILSLLTFYILVSSGSGDLFDARIIFVFFLMSCVSGDGLVKNKISLHNNRK